MSSTIDATNGSTGFWVYSCHLKASQGSSNEDLRESGTQAILNNIATLPSNANIFWGGDFNFYSNSEPGYDLIANTVGSNAIVDPLGSGSWSGSGNAIKHTQSPRSTSSNGGLVTNGRATPASFAGQISAPHHFKFPPEGTSQVCVTSYFRAGIFLM